MILQISAPALGVRRRQRPRAAHGVHVALDGFGSGSLSTTRLPIDALRLDRSLISRIDRDPQHRALCESIVGG